MALLIARIRVLGMAATSYMKASTLDLVPFVLLPMFLFSATLYPITVYPGWVRR